MRLALMLLLSSLAWADKPDPDTEIAKRHFDAGRAKYEASDYLGALEEFEAARKVRQFAAFDYNIARCLDRLERPAEAVAAYERYLAGVPADEPDAAEVRERVRVLKERIVVTPLPPSPPRAPRSDRARLLLGPSLVGAVTVVSLAAGAGLLGSVRVDYDRMASGPDSCRPCSEAQVAPLRTRANAGYAMLGLGGALAVVDVILWVRAKRLSRAARASAGSR
jgi:tetratricopeptide (TPR) repeat protein